MLKRFASQTFAIHARESRKAAREKAKAVVEELRAMKLEEAAKKVEDGIDETLTCCDFRVERGFGKKLDKLSRQAKIKPELKWA